MDEIAILQALAPIVEPATDADVRAARAGLIDHIDGRTRRRIRARLPELAGRRVLVFAAVGALITAGVATGAGAALYLGERGPVTHPATAAEIEAEITSTMAATPLPAGRTYPVDELRARAEPVGNLTTLAGVQQVQFYAMCAWSGSWLAADHAGDGAGAARAAEVIATFPTWQSVADPRLADDSIRTQVGSVVAAASSGDRVPVQALFDGMACDALLGTR